MKKKQQSIYQAHRINDEDKQKKYTTLKLYAPWKRGSGCI